MFSEKAYTRAKVSLPWCQRRLTGSAQVAQGVVHPAHVPHAVMVIAARGRGGRRAARPRRRDSSAIMTMPGWRRYAVVFGFLDEVDGFQVLAVTALVGTPLAVLTRVVQVEYRGHGANDAQVARRGSPPASTGRWRPEVTALRRPKLKT